MRAVAVLGCLVASVVHTTHAQVARAPFRPVFDSTHAADGCGVPADARRGWRSWDLPAGYMLSLPAAFEPVAPAAGRPTAWSGPHSASAEALLVPLVDSVPLRSPLFGIAGAVSGPEGIEVSIGCNDCVQAIRRCSQLAGTERQWIMIGRADGEWDDTDYYVFSGQAVDAETWLVLTVSGPRSSTMELGPLIAESVRRQR
jgi:hypothetical protein